MTQTSGEKSEELIFADDRPTLGGDDLYQWAVDAEDMIRRLHALCAGAGGNCQQILDT